MSFLKLKPIKVTYQPNRFIIRDSLQALIYFLFKRPKKYKVKERTSLFTPAKGSVVIEASLILPLILFASACFLYLFQVMVIQVQVGQALYGTCKEYAVKGYAYEKVLGGKLEEGELGGLVGKGFSIVIVKNEVEQKLEACREIKNANYMLSGFMGEAEVIDIVISYSIPVPFNIFNLPDFKVTQRARSRVWTGYQKEKGTQAEEIVYMTETGTVYHRDINCTHIQLSVRKVEQKQLEGLRNDYGRKYYVCVICKKKGSGGGQVYITNTGNRYHFSNTCSGLKRGVRMVAIAETGGAGPCSRCGRR